MKRHHRGRGARLPAPPSAAPAAGDHPWVLVVLAGLLAFGGGLANRFTYDDRLVIEEAEPLLRDLPLASTVFSQDYFVTSHESTFRPVVTFSYALDYALGGLSPFVYHLQSLLWHLGSALLLYALARRLLPRPARRAALVAGLLFAVHPLLTEAIDNPSFREDPLATFFSLAALLFALRKGRGALAAAIGCYLVALFAKESAFVLPVFLLGARWLLGEQREAREKWLEAGGFAAATLFFILIRFRVMTSGPDYGEYPGGTLVPTVLGTPRIFVHYVKLLVAPWPLCADYSGVFDFPPATRDLVLSVVLLLALVAAGYVAGRRNRLVAFGLGWFLVALGPISNLIAIPVPAAERFLYLPFAGIALAVAAGWAELDARLTDRLRPIARWAGLAAIVALAVLTNLRHPVWHDNMALWGRTVRDFPRAWGARHGYGVELKERGELDRAAGELEAGAGGEADQVGERAHHQRPRHRLRHAEPARPVGAAAAPRAGGQPGRQDLPEPGDHALAPGRRGGRRSGVRAGGGEEPALRAGLRHAGVAQAAARRARGGAAQFRAGAAHQLQGPGGGAARARPAAGAAAATAGVAQEARSGQQERGARDRARRRRRARPALDGAARDGRPLRRHQRAAGAVPGPAVPGRRPGRRPARNARDAGRARDAGCAGDAAAARPHGAAALTLTLPDLYWTSTKKLPVALQVPGPVLVKVPLTRESPSAVPVNS